MITDRVFIRNGVERCLTFLNESNHIEGIKCIDYRKEAFQDPDKGHFGAFILSQRQADEHKPISIKDICRWQALITKEQEIEGLKLNEEEIGHIRGPNNQKNVRIAKHIPPSYETVPVRIANLIEDINEGLKEQEKLTNDAAYCEFLGKMFYQFMWIHPFSDGNGRVGRLLANYIATYCGRPVMVFNAELSARNRYYEAHESPETMCQFMARKIKEVVFNFFTGSLLFKQKEQSGSTIEYGSADNSEKLYYEWHALDQTYPNQPQL